MSDEFSNRSVWANLLKSLGIFVVLAICIVIKTANAKKISLAQLWKALEFNPVLIERTMMGLYALAILWFVWYIYGPGISKK